MPSLRVLLIPAVTFVIQSGAWGGGGALAAQRPDGDEPLVSLRLDRDPFELRQGDRVRVYYNVSRDAWVAVFHVGSDGRVDLVFPQGPRDRNRVLGGREYRVLFEDSAYWTIAEPPGRGHLFVLAAPQPLELAPLPFSVRDDRWDLPQDRERFRADPYAALDALIPTILPEWEAVAYRLEALEYRVVGREEGR